MRPDSIPTAIIPLLSTGLGVVQDREVTLVLKVGRVMSSCMVEEDLLTSHIFTVLSLEPVANWWVNGDGFHEHAHTILLCASCLVTSL